jgi:hypothetical protein
MYNQYSDFRFQFSNKCSEQDLISPQTPRNTPPPAILSFNLHISRTSKTLADSDSRPPRCSTEKLKEAKKLCVVRGFKTLRVISRKKIFSEVIGIWNIGKIGGNPCGIYFDCISGKSSTIGIGVCVWCCFVEGWNPGVFSPMPTQMT